jgi:uncharacterized membrane protein
METAQLIAYLDRKFASLEDIFATKEELHDLEVRMSLKMDTGIESLEKKMDKRFSELYKFLDDQTQEMRTFYQELKMTQGRVDRHERWHHEVVEKLGMRLES